MLPASERGPRPSSRTFTSLTLDRLWACAQAASRWIAANPGVYELLRECMVVKCDGVLRKAYSRLARNYHVHRGEIFDALQEGHQILRHDV